MIKPYRIVVFSVSLFSFCAIYAGGPDSPISAAADVMLNKMYNVTDFDTIVADGYFDLAIKGGASTKALVKTSSYESSPIMISVHDRTLYLTSKYSTTNPGMYLPNHPHPRVNIQLADLKGLEVYGPVNVSSTQIPTKSLSLVAEGYGVIRLQNAGNIRVIKQSGNNRVEISGITSKKLALHAADFGKTTLQGNVNQFYARLNHDATLQARNLMANHISIQAKYNSQAYIYPIKSLRAFSDKSGEIYYYKHLTNLTRFPIQSGNVLEMQG